MKIAKFFLVTVIITMCTILYVHQNIEIFKIGYSINSRQKTLSNFLDRHRRLVYNLNKLSSPLALDKRLRAEEIELVEADTASIYYASANGTDNISSGLISKRRKSIIDNVLDIFTEQAEARVR